MIRSFADLFEVWTIAELAARLPAKYQTVAGMKRRARVSSMWWPRLIELARQDGHVLDADLLFAFAKAAKGVPALTRGETRQKARPRNSAAPPKQRRRATATKSASPLNGDENQPHYTRMG